jgi:hypothetical protein
VVGAAELHRPRAETRAERIDVQMVAIMRCLLALLGLCVIYLDRNPAQ